MLYPLMAVLPDERCRSMPGGRLRTAGPKTDSGHRTATFKFYEGLEHPTQTARNWNLKVLTAVNK